MSIGRMYDSIGIAKLDIRRAPAPHRRIDIATGVVKLVSLDFQVSGDLACGRISDTSASSDVAEA